MYKSIVNSWLILYLFDLNKMKNPKKPQQQHIHRRRNGAKIDTPDSRLHRQNCLCSTEYIKNLTNVYR